MVVHIAPIGKETKHVEEWLREVTPVTKIWLIHSKKKDGREDFTKNAKDLAKKIKKDYAGVEVEQYLIDDPFGINDTMDAISEIVSIEGDVERQEFAVNVTGGTNAMATGAILQAMLLGTKAYYVKNRNKNPGQKKYVDELPIPSIGIVKMNNVQQKVLRMISENEHILRDPSTKKVENREVGMATNQELLKKLKWNDEYDNGIRKRQRGATRIAYILKELEKKGYVEKIHGVEEFVPKLSIRSDRLGTKDGYERKKNESKVKWRITSAGKRQAKNAMMKEE
tara:strand:- start:22 stop:867 length:846 start_codon:yes stop_codon:yes gene_type:complete